MPPQQQYLSSAPRKRRLLGKKTVLLALAIMLITAAATWNISVHKQLKASIVAANYAQKSAEDAPLVRI